MLDPPTSGYLAMTKLNDPQELIGIGAVIAAATLLARPAQALSGKLLVFLHVAVKQRALQSELQGALGGLEVTTVGRVGDFERGLKEGVDAVLSLPAVLSAFKLSAKLRGARGGSTEEKYSLVGTSGEPVPSQVGAVGALDLLGRDGTNSFVKELLGATPRIERVSKVEDLLPLLQMQRVDAVLLPSRLFNEIKSASKLTLVQKELGKSVGLPAVATVKSSGDAIVSAIAKMPAPVSKKLGVDSWR
jgi:hypothetical protein